MSWELIKGITPKPELPIKRCLRLDGVNDYLTLGNSPFYNIGTGQASYLIRFMLNSIANNATSLFRTNEYIGSAKRFLIGTLYNSALYMTFNDGLSSSSTEIHFYEVLNPGIWYTLIVVRTGSNSDKPSEPGWDQSIRNPDTYKVILNGELLQYDHIVNLRADGLPIDLDSEENKLVGGTPASGQYTQGYLDTFALWNKALSPEEIQNINNGIITDDMSKGIFLFDGNTLDSSSVQGTMTLINSATPPHITYPYKDGVIPFLKSTSNQIKEFKYPENVVITKIWKERSSYNGFQYSFDNSTWLSIPDGELVNVYIVVPANTILYIKDPTSRGNYNVLHLDFE